MKSRINILAIGGLDPSGGAGLAADIQTIGALGAHCLPLCTDITVQNGENFAARNPVSADILSEQLDLLQQNHHISAVKIGVLGSETQIDVISDFLKTLNNIPVIYDPVVKSSCGGALCSITMLHAIKDKLLPQCTLCTPNLPELLTLVETTESNSAVEHWFQLKNTGSLLVTGGHGDLWTKTNTAKASAEQNSRTLLVNQLFMTADRSHDFKIDRSEGEFRGTGCSFSSAIATILAMNGSNNKGQSIEGKLSQAIDEAQKYLKNAIENAYLSNGNSSIPNRMSSK